MRSAGCSGCRDKWAKNTKWVVQKIDSDGKQIADALRKEPFYVLSQTHVDEHQ